jgi:hypothetical protein
MTTAPESLAAVSARGRHLELFRITGGRIQHRWWLGDDPSWTPWHSVASPNDLVAIAAAACADDSITIFALTRSGQMYVRWWTLQDWWGEWESLGGPVYPPIAATSLQYGHLEVYAHSGEGYDAPRCLAPAGPLLPRAGMTRPLTGLRPVSPVSRSYPLLKPRCYPELGRCPGGDPAG